MRAVGCDESTAIEIADHLVDADLAGIESHGIQRLVQYTKQAKLGLWTPASRPHVAQNAQGAWIVNGNDGIGISAVRLAVAKACELMKESEAGMATVGVVNCGHTG
jgi:LDH2 family malate/lactate/ureidoglycolate dehydrogenase